MEETPRAMEVYQQYAELGTERSLEKVHELYKKRAKDALPEKIKVPAITTLKTWSTNFAWQRRVKEFDTARIAEEATVKRLKRLKLAEKTDEEQGDAARLLWIKTVKLLSKRIDNEDISSNVLAILLKDSWETHRLSTGNITARVANELSSSPDAPVKIVAEFGVYIASGSDEREE